MAARQTKEAKSERQMEKVLKRRAKAMVAAVEAGYSEEELQKFFEKCLDAHHTDVLRDLGRTL